MASRYLRASGNWNGAVWAATSSGAAGSASTPTINDEVVIASNYTVTLTADASAATILHTNGKVLFNGYKLTVDANFVSSGSTARTINMTNGELVFSGKGLPQFELSGSNLTVVSTGSLITFNQTWSLRSSSTHFATANKVFNDVRINLGSGTKSTVFNITGSPTFRSLIIQSKNSAAHTVRFDSGATITTNKFVAIGSSSSSKLTVKPSSGSSTIALSSGGSTYGQFVDMQASASGAGVPKYIGANSTQSSGIGWLLQNPPKISTLVDTLTTAPGSNPNWTVSGDGVSAISSGISGGGYTVYEDDEGIQTSLISTDTYDLVGSSLIFEVPEFYGNNAETQFGLYLYTGAQFETGSFKYLGRPSGGASMAYGLSVTQAEAATISGRRFFKISNSSGNTIVSAYSTNGTSWTTIRTDSVGDINLYRSVRIGVPSTPNGRALYIGSINPSFAVDIDTNSVSSSVSISTPSISKTASLSAQGHGVGTSMSTTDIQSVIVLDTDSIGTSTSMSEPSMVLIRGVLPNSMSIGVSADNLGLLLKAGVLPDNMEIVTASSIPSISGNIFIFTDDMLVGLNEDEVSVAALRNMDVDVMSIMPAILATAVQIGYPTSDINADNIYAIGSMREGEYGIATINNNQIYEVVEQDGI